MHFNVNNKRRSIEIYIPSTNDIIIKTYISNAMHMMRLWNNLLKLSAKVKTLKSHTNVLGEGNSKIHQERIIYYNRMNSV